MIVKEIKIAGILTIVVVIIILIFQGLSEKTPYEDSEITLIEKKDNWEQCLGAGQVETNENGVYIGCDLNGESIEPFTYQDLQELATMVDKEIKNQGEIEIQKERGENLIDKIINEIK